MLLLLTYADMEATGVLSPMKIRFLEDLYYRADAAMEGGQPPAATPDDTAFSVLPSVSQMRGL